MPISREDFDEGRSEDSDESLVIRFLGSHPDQAYSAEELADGIGHDLARPLNPAASRASADLRALGKDVRLANFETFLVRLASEGKIARKIVELKSGRSWYFASKI